MPLILRAARLFDGRQLLRDAAVVIDAGVIQAVGPAAELLPLDSTRVANKEQFDLGDRTLLPGLIDGHVHLTFSGGEQAMVDVVRDSDELLLLRAVRNAERALRAGITTVRDCGDRHNVTFTLRDAIRSGVVRGPRLVACGMPITTTAGHCHFLGLVADTTDELVRAVRRQAQAGADSIKVMATGGRLTPGSNASEAQYSAEQLRLVVEDAHRLGRRVAMHVLGTSGIRNAVAAGADTLEHLSWLQGDDERAYDEELVAQLVTKRLWASVTNGHSRRMHRVMLGERLNLSPAERQALDVYEVQLGLIDRMYRSGTPLLVTDDAGVPDVDIADFPFALASLGTRTSVEPIDVIQMATSKAAAALGLDASIGTIEVGKQADLLAVDGDPTQDVLDLTRTAFVFQGGRLVCAEGKLL